MSWSIIGDTAMAKRRSSRIVLALILFSILVAVIYLFYGFDERLDEQWTRISKGGPPYFIEGIAVADDEVSAIEEEIFCSRRNAIVKASQKVGPSVVSISTIQVRVVRDTWFWNDFFSPYGSGRRQKHYGLGSGFIIDNRGYVLTNHHVIEDADEIKITLSNGNGYEAKIIGADYESDLAVLKVDAKEKLVAAELGNSSDLMVGEWAIAVGNPFGFLIEDSTPSVSLGVISATGRAFREEARSFNNLIQTDATVNPGNSGGPLVNCYGQVIGINTAIFSTSGGSQGVGFAIPINTAKNVINDLIQHGMVTEPWIGIEYQQLSKEIASHLDSPASEGVLISNVVQDSPAQTAGLMRGDIIAKIDDKSIKSLEDATASIDSLKSDQQAIFRIIRSGEYQEVSVTVGKTEAAEIARTWLGMVVQKPTPEAAIRYKLSSYEKGVLVIQIDRKSAAYEAELQRGDLILKMAKERTGALRYYREVDITNLDDFRKFVSGIKKNQRIRIIFERQGKLWRTQLAAEK